MVTNNDLKQLIQRDCRHGSKEGHVKPQLANKLLHETVKFQIVYWLRKHKYEVYTEAAFTNKKGKADIVCMQNGQGFCIEVLNTESDERFNKKSYYYPKDFTLVRVRADEFDYNTFKL